MEPGRRIGSVTPRTVRDLLTSRGFNVEKRVAALDFKMARLEISSRTDRTGRFNVEANIRWWCNDSRSQLIEAGLDLALVYANPADLVMIDKWLKEVQNLFESDLFDFEVAKRKFSEGDLEKYSPIGVNLRQSGKNGFASSSWTWGEAVLGGPLDSDVGSGS